jgi:hypothetical protein
MGQVDEIWFDLPSDVDAMLSGYTMDPGRSCLVRVEVSLITAGTVPPSPSVNHPSTVFSEIMQTPTSTITAPIFPSNDKFQQSQAQAMAQRSGQGRVSMNSLLSMDTTALQNLLAAVNNNNDNDPQKTAAAQKIQHLLALKQQQRLNAGTHYALNGNGNTGGTSMTNGQLAGDNTQDQQAVLNALQLQREAQMKSQGVNFGPPTQGVNGMPQKFWSGDLAMPGKMPQGESYFLFLRMY